MTVRVQVARCPLKHPIRFFQDLIHEWHARQRTIPVGIHPLNTLDGYSIHLLLYAVLRQCPLPSTVLYSRVGGDRAVIRGGCSIGKALVAN